MFLFKVLNGALLRVAVIGIISLVVGLLTESMTVSNVILLFSLFIYVLKDRYFEELAKIVAEELKSQKVSSKD